MYHYRVYDSLTGTVVLDSSRREEFDGYSTMEKAYMVGLGAKVENNLSDLHVVEAYEAQTIEDFILEVESNELTAADYWDGDGSYSE